MRAELDPDARSALHSALADPSRLRIVDELALSDRSPSDLADSLTISSNLLAHHLDVLEEVGLIDRLVSAGDGRRRYIRLIPEPLAALAVPLVTIVAGRVLFVCKANSARSPMAAAVWNARSEVPATSAGTDPGREIRSAAVQAAGRAGLDLSGVYPRAISEITEVPDLIVTVCDVANEELAALVGVPRLHWSIPDPAGRGPAAFDEALRLITSRVETLAPRVRPPASRPRRRTRR
jgi:protein-tyrosine-phosphatase/DNA-binding HxlR family transcriptional regulator